MAEIFKPRANMTYDEHYDCWECRDESGYLVCDGGPSVIWDEGTKWQFIVANIGLHCLDNPASYDGRWFINNKDVTEEIKIFAKENSIDLDTLTEEEKVLIALKFS